MLGDGRLRGTALGVHMDLVGGGMPQCARTRSWYGWGLPGPDIARFHEVVSAVHREAPWELPGDFVDLAVFLAGGAGRWRFSTEARENGPSMEVYGPIEPEESPGEADRACVEVHFQRRDEVPASLREEVAREGWMLAGADAYPVIAVGGTPASLGLEAPPRSLAARHPARDPLVAPS